MRPPIEKHPPPRVLGRSPLGSRRLLIRLLLTGLCAAIVVLIWGLSKPVAFQRHGSFFGSWVHVTVVAKRWQADRVEEALDEVWRRFEDIHVRLGADHPLSEIRALNEHPNEPISVSDDVYQLMQQSIHFYQLSNGIFNPAIEPILRLWRNAAREHRLPSKDQIHQALSQCDIYKIQLREGNRVLLQDGVRLRLDSIGDGYAADEAARILKEHGFNDFLVDASGEMQAQGFNARGEDWRVGIQHPADPQRLWAVVAVSGRAVSTSGSYERGVEIGGRWYSHIIDPRTGRPAQGPLSATAICPSAVFADFVSTVLCVLSPQEGLSWVKSLSQPCAVLILDREGEGIKEYKTSDWDDFVLPTAPYGIQ